LLFAVVLWVSCSPSPSPADEGAVTDAASDAPLQAASDPGGQPDGQPEAPGDTPATTVPDTQPPQIFGAADIELQVGSFFDPMEGVTATDDIDGQPELLADASGLDLGTPGAYEVIYKARDKAGNESELRITVTVKAVQAKTLYLTFDDGPSKYTEELLDLLDKHQVKATFFVTGNHDGRLFSMIVDRGHSIGLHSDTHSYSSVYSSDEAYLADLDSVSRQVEAAVGFAPKIMRFVGGSSNTISKQYSEGIMTRLTEKVHQLGYRYYDWNCSVGDGGNVSAEQEIEQVKSMAPGLNVMYLLAHDTKPQTIEAMRTIIPYLLGEGYTFHTITPDTPECHHRVSN
jgi:peptidoglycan/xylan/chitin deacetylase (PgdA/CDA1 family)